MINKVLVQIQFQKKNQLNIILCHALLSCLGSFVSLQSYKFENEYQALFALYVYEI